MCRNMYLHKTLKLWLQHAQTAWKMCQFQAFAQTRSLRRNSLGTLDSTLVIRIGEHPQYSIFSISVMHDTTPESITTAQHWCGTVKYYHTHVRNEAMGAREHHDIPT